MMPAVIIFILGGLALFHSYFIYPLWMKQKGKNYNPQFPGFTDSLPSLAILLSVYNEEKVIEQKIRSTFDTDYPLDKIKFLIGSDNSDDQTNDILQKLKSEFPAQLEIEIFNERTGKPEIINRLVEQTESDILVLTDADTFFYPQTLHELAKPFSDHKIGGVQAGFRFYKEGKAAASRQELVYSSREFEIKKGQSFYGHVIGAFGACYALRRKLYKPVPKGFFVDDFLIFMKVLEQGYKTVYNEKALCKMPVSGESRVQFNRKARIGQGNFQNFFHLKSFLNPFASRTNFSYYSYKVIRWWGPFILLLLLICNFYIYRLHPIFLLSLAGQLTIYAAFLADFILKKININLGLVRNIHHFVLMNIALALGFFRLWNKKKTASWRN